jgi:hypothetical protein
MPLPHLTTPMTPSPWIKTSLRKSSPYKHTTMPLHPLTQYNMSPHPLLHPSKRSTHLLSMSELTKQLKVAHTHHSHLAQPKPSLEWVEMKSLGPLLRLSCLDWWPPSIDAPPSQNNTLQQPTDMPTNWPASLNNAMLRYTNSKHGQAMLTCP